MIILDTNVLSEALRPRPSALVTRWMRTQHPSDLFTTAICEAEMLYGVAIMPDGRRRGVLHAAVRAIFDIEFDERVLAFDAVAAKAYADIVAARRRTGHPIAQADAQIAAIARANGAMLATRNLADFADCDVRVVNPFEPT
jgi:toxin FitB